MDKELELLLKNCKIGNEDAYEKILRRFEPLMKKMAGLYSVPSLDSQDLVQEASMVLYHVIRRFDLEKSKNFPAYYKIALRNHIFSRLRKELKYQPTLIEWDEYQTQESIREMDDSSRVKRIGPDESVLLKEETVAYLHNLSSMEKEVLTDYLSGKPFDIIAQEKGKTVRSVEQAYARCRKKLKQELQAKRKQASLYRLPEKTHELVRQAEN